MKKNLVIYFAGKIGQNDWRHDIVKELRNSEAGEILDIGNECLYIGPYFISCDHGCFHGRNSHGRTYSGCTSTQGSGDSHQRIQDICLNQIDYCDLVFAYIDDIDAYGTISEIGYSKAKGKGIVLFTQEGLVCDSDLWFVKKLCDVVDTAKSGKEAREIFIKKYRKLF